jgi:TonB family protein
MKILQLLSQIFYFAWCLLFSSFAFAQSPDAAQQKAPVVIRQSTEMLVNSAMKRITPEYPAKARAQNISGEAEIEIKIDEAGNVISTKPVSGQQFLMDAAMKALKEWKFRPTQFKGAPVQVIGTMVFTFHQDGSVSDGSSAQTIKPQEVRSVENVAVAEPANGNISEKEAKELEQKLKDAYDVPIRINNPDGIILEITKATVRAVKRNEQDYAKSDTAAFYVTDYVFDGSIFLHNRTDKGITGVGLKFTNTQTQNLFFIYRQVSEIKPQDTEQLQINFLKIGGDPTNLQVEVVGVGFSNGKNVGAYPQYPTNAIQSSPPVNPKVDTKPRPLNTFRLTHTDRINGVTGIIRLHVEIGADGSVKRIQVMNALPEGFTDEAIRVVKVMQFKPAMLNGSPVDYTIALEFEFLKV